MMEKKFGRSIREKEKKKKLDDKCIDLVEKRKRFIIDKIISYTTRCFMT